MDIEIKNNYTMLYERNGNGDSVLNRSLIIRAVDKYPVGVYNNPMGRYSCRV